ncbi:hypothetical protein COOONC_10348 [Cooperia oncophora]
MWTKPTTLFTTNTFAVVSGTRQAQVNRAIEQTQARQMTAPAGMRSASRPMQNTPGRSEPLDVEKLNQLIRALDKTWIFPRSGAKDPVGSNFQYKKTCASIFKARHGACQQLSFGVMCFNYCHERGEVKSVCYTVDEDTIVLKKSLTLTICGNKP